MSGAIPLLPQYAFMALCLVKAQGQLYLLFNFLCHYVIVYILSPVTFIDDTACLCDSSLIYLFVITKVLMFELWFAGSMRPDSKRIYPRTNLCSHL